MMLKSKKIESSYLSFMCSLFILASGCGRSGFEGRSNLKDYDRNLFSYVEGHDQPTMPDIGNGAGPYGQHEPTEQMILCKNMITTGLSLPMASEKYGEDAVRHLSHYFENTGTNLDVNMISLLESSKAAKEHFEFELSEAKRLAEVLSPGKYDIVSKSVTGISVTASDSPNWYRAVGSYYGWGQAEVTVSENEHGTTKYEINFTYHLFDAYNWEPGDTEFIHLPFLPCKITGTTMGEFHRQGLAREFLMTGAYTK